MPVLNEPGLPDFLGRLHEVMTEIPERYEILIAMGDREKLYPTIPPFPNQRIIKTYGDTLERSILAGFSHAKGTKILVCDVDNYHPFYKIPEMIKLLDMYEMVAGSRYLPEGELNMSLFRRFVSRFFVMYAHLFGSNLSDPMTGFFAVRKDIVNKIMFRPFTWKTCLEIELKAKPHLVEIPIVPKPRTSGVSKTKLKTGFKLMRDIILG